MADEIRSATTLAARTPLKTLVVVLGDFNFSTVPPRFSDALPTPLVLQGLQEWRSQGSAVLSGVLRDLLEFEFPEFKHFYKPGNKLTKLDRGFISTPGWLCNQLCIGGEAFEHPEVVDKKGLSDHSPILFSLATVQKIPPSERPIMKEVFQSLQYRRFLEKAFQQGPTEGMLPPLGMEYQSMLMREAARFARDNAAKPPGWCSSVR